MTQPWRPNKSSWLMPSMADLLILLCFAGYVFYMPQIKSFDIWWHLETGKMILAGYFPKVDVLSFTAAGRPWTLHEWGSEVLFFLLFKHFGATGLVALRAMVAALTIATVYRLLVRQGLHTLLALSLTLAAGVLFHKSWSMRPHIFSLLFIVLVFYIVNEYSRYGRRRPLAWLPLIFLVWINLHGGFVVGFLFLGLWTIGEAINVLLNQRPDKSLRHLFPLILWSALAFLAAFVNPNTYEGVLYPVLYSGNSDLPLDVVAEWYPADWVNSKYFIFYNFFVIGVLFLSSFRLPAGHLLMIVVFGLYAFRYHRITPFYAAVTIPLVALSFQHLLRQGWDTIPAYSPALYKKMRFLSGYMQQRARRIDAFGQRSSRYLFLFLALSLSFGLLLSGGMDSLLPLGINKFKYPFENIRYLKDHPQPGNLFNRFRWGGLIAWCLPGKKVFIDGRIDVYGKQITEEYGTVLQLEEGWREILAKYNITHILINPEAPLARHITALDRDWRLVADDGVSLLFFKNASSSE